MARAIASRENPLTARVMVNRVWLHLFGKPIVQTPSDFGTRSDPPTHPKLLDHLATQFMNNGWSVKDLCRYILLSSSYRQSSQGFFTTRNWTFRALHFDLRCKHPIVPFSQVKRQSTNQTELTLPTRICHLDLEKWVR